MDRNRSAAAPLDAHEPRSRMNPGRPCRSVGEGNGAKGRGDRTRSWRRYPARSIAPSRKMLP